MKLNQTTIALLLIVCHGAPAGVENRQPGIEGKVAPSWNVKHWINLPKGSDQLDVTDYHGKVIYLYCFQSWCPGCHRHGFPTLQKLMEHYQGNDEVVFVSVQTAFEGFAANSPQRGRQTAERYQLKIPVGHSGTADEASELMRRYRTGGTPWVIIIDRQGRVRFNGFHVEPNGAVRLIDQLQAETQTFTHGRERIRAATMPNLKFKRWVIGPEEKSGTAKLTLYQWFKDEPANDHVRLAALQRLREKYSSDGLHVVAVYCPSLADNDIRETTQHQPYRGALAIDPQGQQLGRIIPINEWENISSVTFLVDDNNRILFHSRAGTLSGHDANNLFDLLEPHVKRLLTQNGDN